MLESETADTESGRLRAEAHHGSVPEIRADFALPTQDELEELTSHLCDGVQALPAPDQLTIAMGALQSELQRLLSSVHEWCDHALAEQQDLGWECSLVFSIELAQAAQRLETQHQQIAIGYAPLPQQRAWSVGWGLDRALARNS